MPRRAALMFARQHREKQQDETARGPEPRRRYQQVRSSNSQFVQDEIGFPLLA
jgi:hypothetical protein